MMGDYLTTFGLNVNSFEVEEAISISGENLQGYAVLPLCLLQLVESCQGVNNLGKEKGWE